MITNARNLTSKSGKLKVLVHEEYNDLIGVTESWLHSSNNWTIIIPGFTLFLRDRVNRKGGGVCFYVRNDLKMNLKDDLVAKCDRAEILWVKLHMDVHFAK